jgi:hypothetical protein
MTITITAFERSLNGGKGLARDTRVRWALEEVGQPYGVRLVSFQARSVSFAQLSCSALNWGAGVAEAGQSAKLPLAKREASL